MSFDAPAMGLAELALTNQVPAATSAVNGTRQRPDQVRQAAEDFEAVFLSQMLEPMFKNLDAEGPFGGGSGESIYRSLLVQEFGKSISRAGGVGIADSVQREILKLQEVQQ